jgi:hypothetical protein
MVSMFVQTKGGLMIGMINKIEHCNSPKCPLFVEDINLACKAFLTNIYSFFFDYGKREWL